MVLNVLRHNVRCTSFIYKALLVAEGMLLTVGHQSCSHRLYLRDRKRRLNESYFPYVLIRNVIIFYFQFGPVLGLVDGNLQQTSIQHSLCCSFVCSLGIMFSLLIIIFNLIIILTGCCNNCDFQKTGKLIPCNK
jgi:hypothetical protein